MSEATRKIKVVIVDDEPLARRGICQLLESERDFEIVGEAANGHEAISALRKLAPDLIFLDVQMPLLDGFSFVEQAGAQIELLPEIVFVTAYDEHAIRAFEAGAIDYVLKPINTERFCKTLERVRRRRASFAASASGALENKFTDLLKLLKPAENYLERIVVRENERIRFLSVERIEQIRSQGNYIEIYAGDGEKFLLRETMDSIESKLNPKDFVRLRRSAIVRISQIKELHQLFGGEFEVVLKSGAKAASSRRYRKNLDALLGR